MLYYVVIAKGRKNPTVFVSSFVLLLEVQVCLDVSVERTLAWECLLADRTAVRSLSRMSSDVVLQVVVLPVLFCTIRTLELLPQGVLRVRVSSVGSHVHSEFPFYVKCFLAHAAAVRALSNVASMMCY